MLFYHTDSCCTWLLSQLWLTRVNKLYPNMLGYYWESDANNCPEKTSSLNQFYEGVCKISTYWVNIGPSLVAQRLKRLPPMWETWVRSLGWEDPLEKEMVTHSSILAWRIPWTKEPGGLQSIGSQRVGHDWATSLHFTSLHLQTETSL